jgi:hypothetical protein
MLTSKVRTWMSMSLGLVLAACLAPASAAQVCHSIAGIQALGAGTPGSAGVPLLETSGAPIVGQGGFSLKLSQGPAHAASAILIGEYFGPSNVLALGGTLYLAKPYHHPRVQLDATGAGSFPMPQVQSMPAMFCGMTLYAQAVVMDPAAMGGFSLSNAIAIKFGT